jgi:hypothetical protein
MGGGARKRRAEARRIGWVLILQGWVLTVRGGG